MSGHIRVTPCGREAAEEVHRLTQLAFGEYGWLTPPSGAMDETVDLVRRELEESGGALAAMRGTTQAVGALRVVTESDRLHVRRVAVDPAFQGKGVGTALMDWAWEEAERRGCSEVWVGVQAQLPRNRTFYEGLGYRVIAEHTHPEAPEMVWHEMTLQISPPHLVGRSPAKPAGGGRTPSH